VHSVGQKAIRVVSV